MDSKNRVNLVHGETETAFTAVLKLQDHKLKNTPGE